MKILRSFFCTQQETPHCAALQCVLVIFIVALASSCQELPVRPPSSSIPREVAVEQAQRMAAVIGGRWWSVEGSSMRPFLSENTIVVTEPAHFEELKPGDVVVYRNQRLKCITHRLRELRGTAWVVCGDANAYADTERVTRDNYLGRQCAVFFTQ